MKTIKLLYFLIKPICSLDVTKLYCTWVWTSVAWIFFPVWISHFILIHCFLHSFILSFFHYYLLLPIIPKSPTTPTEQTSAFLPRQNCSLLFLSVLSWSLLYKECSLNLWFCWWRNPFFQLFLDFRAQPLWLSPKGLSPLARPSNPPRAKKGIPWLTDQKTPNLTKSIPLNPDSNIMEPSPCTSPRLRAFQSTQEHDLKHPWVDLITTKQNKLPSFTERYP
jgi:hypothetical protein